jgi:hypothetical protein
MPHLPGLLAPAVAAAAMAAGLAPAWGTSLEAIHELEGLINASGTETVLSTVCPPNHAAYYENDGKGIDRLVVCANRVDLADPAAVWEVMAHEATHVMQACRGGHILPDAAMSSTYRQLRRSAPLNAKLLDDGYRRADVRLEAEAFWMELQPPATVLAHFRQACRRYLQGGRSHRLP